MQEAAQRLSPVPAPGPALAEGRAHAEMELLGEIAEHELAEVAGEPEASEPCGEARGGGGLARHAAHPVSNWRSSPSVIARKWRQARAAARLPAGSTSTCLRRRPPRSGVGSPM